MNALLCQLVGDFTELRLCGLLPVVGKDCTVARNHLLGVSVQHSQRP